MAFTKPYTIKFSNSKEKYIEFLHEIIRTPLKDELFLEDGFHKPHTQEFYELIFYNSGGRYVRIGPNEYEFGAGDIFVVCPDEEHGGKSIACMLDRCYIHISPEAFSDLKDGANLMKVFSDREKYTNNKITPPPEAQETIRRLLTEIDNTVRFGNKQTKDNEAYGLIIRLLGVVNGCMKSVAPAKDKLLLNILSFIENSYPDCDVMEEVLKHFSVSRSSLWRLFKSQLNTSPYSYLQKVRLENARLMLKAGYDVTNASMQCGFSDCSHFIKKFKEKYGVTPYKYKTGRL